MKRRGEKLGALREHQRERLPATGVAVDIDLAAVNGVSVEQIFRQRDGLLRRGVAPIAQLRRGYDHFVVVLLRLKNKVFRADVLADALKVQPFIAGERDVQGVRFAFVVAFGDVQMKMNVPDIRMQDIVHQETAIGLASRAYIVIRFLRRLFGCFRSAGGRTACFITCFRRFGVRVRLVRNGFRRTCGTSGKREEENCAKDQRKCPFHTDRPISYACFMAGDALISPF